MGQEEEKTLPDIEGVDDEVLQSIVNDAEWEDCKIPEAVEIAMVELQRRATLRGRY